MSELLGCPFCGKPAIESWSRDNEVVNIRCSNWRSNVCLGAGPNSYNLDEAIAAWNRRAQPAWQPMDTAPKDGTPILALCDHDSDPYTHDEGRTLTTYATHCEGIGNVIDGPHVVEWGGEWSEHSDIDGQPFYVPSWWFLYGSHFEVVANPIGWMPIPEAP